MSRSSGTFFGDPGMRGNGPPNIDGMVTLKIDNIPFNCTVEELRYAFESLQTEKTGHWQRKSWGELGDVYIPRDLHSGNPRGFAFVRYIDQRDADYAIDRMDGERLGGRQLRIQYAKRRRPDYDSYRTRGGGYSGDYGRDDYRRERSRSYDRRRSRSRSYERRRGHSRSRSKRRGRRSPSPRRRHSYSRSHSPRRRSRSPSQSRSKSPRRHRKHEDHEDRRLSDAEPRRADNDRNKDEHDQHNGHGRANGHSVEVETRNGTAIGKHGSPGGDRRD